MTEAAMSSSTVATTASATPARRDIGLKKRHAAEARFRFYGVAAICIGIAFLAILLVSIIGKGYTAFVQTSISVPVYFDPQIIDKDNERAANPRVLVSANYPVVARNAVAAALGVDPEDKAAMRQVAGMVSDGSRAQLRAMVQANPSIIGTTQPVTLLASGDLDSANKGQVDLSVDEGRRKINNQQLAWMQQLRQAGQLSTEFNWGLLTFGASSRAETAGLGVALIGSAFMMLIVVAVGVPLGVAASVYLEEFAKKNRFTDFVEVNINNLAAVPSIVFGLLGLAVFINFFGMPRSAPIVGGLVLTLMTLPTIIIATRAALRSVPPSIRTAALGVGASKMQMVFDHVLPLATPGILTGTIIGLARALGETAPLLLIGMVAFVADAPSNPLQPATALPVQIYMWTNEAERAFVERTSGAIIVLLVFLAIMNITAIILRRRFERRW
ncbi:MAG TPA: phosphate ABC transporter permease PstA [Devosia sp.]